MGALLVGRTVTNNGLGTNQGRLTGFGACSFNRRLDSRRIVTVNFRNNMPAVGFKPLGCVVGKPAFNVPINRDAIVVPEGDELVQTQGARQRTGLVRNTFHHAAVTEENVGIVIDNLVTFAVELGRKNLFCQCHTHAVSNTLTQRSSSGFNAWGVAQFRVARSFGVQLTELLEIVDGQVIPRQMQQGINEHGAVAIGKHETVAVYPVWVLRVVLEEVIPQDFGNICHAHWGTGVAGVGLLNGIHTEDANSVGKLLTRGHEAQSSLILTRLISGRLSLNRFLCVVGWSLADLLSNNCVFAN